MCRITWFFVFLLVAGASEARQLSTQSRTWDVSATAGSFHGESPDTTPSGNPADWHHAPEWRVTAGPSVARS